MRHRTRRYQVLLDCRRIHSVALQTLLIVMEPKRLENVKMLFEWKMRKKCTWMMFLLFDVLNEY